MSVTFEELDAGKRLAGVIADGEVTVVAVEIHGATSATLTYRAGDGQLGERIVTVDDLAGISEVSERRGGVGGAGVGRGRGSGGGGRVLGGGGGRF